MYGTQTQTATYTVIDIRKTFEGFDADLRMIAKRTGKWSTEYVDKVLHDIIKLAEEKYISHVDITLLNTVDHPLKATRFTINEDGKAVTGERPGGNDWLDIPNTRLAVIVAYNTRWHSLTDQQKRDFARNNNFKIDWVTSQIDNSYSHLQRESGQLYASKGYELQKANFR